MLYARALRGLSSSAGGCGSEVVELRVTCLCEGSATERAQLRRALCEAGSQDEESIADYEEFSDVLVMEEFGDHLCSAVLILLPDVARRVELAACALQKGKHVLLEPWSPGSTTAARWDGLDDVFRRLWDALRNSDGRALCEFVHPVDAVARLFTTWLWSQGFVPSGAIANCTVVSPDRLIDRLPSSGVVGPEKIACLRPLRSWLGSHIGPRAQQSLQLSGIVDKDVSVFLLGPAAGSEEEEAEFPNGCPGAMAASAAVLTWPAAPSAARVGAEDVGAAGAAAAQPFACRYVLAGASSTAALELAGFFGAAEAEVGAVVPGRASGAVVATSSTAAAGAGCGAFACDEVEAVARSCSGSPA
mmetsp:Transcript_10596/g.28116  ORF Transcript_10596/g.28116 Transcript_10596/m.28116 type:complete len:360 (+) Transcript_10596:125-1204(+)